MFKYFYDLQLNIFELLLKYSLVSTFLFSFYHCGSIKFGRASFGDVKVKSESVFEPQQFQELPHRCNGMDGQKPLARLKVLSSVCVQSTKITHNSEHPPCSLVSNNLLNPEPCYLFIPITLRSMVPKGNSIALDPSITALTPSTAKKDESYSLKKKR